MRGSYVYNGAGTGRFSSRGVQVHNLIRAPLSDDPNAAIDAMDMICNGVPADELRAEFGISLSGLLSRLLRPTIQASPEHVLVWGDWSQIEARALPWLADTPGATHKLQLFVTGEDPYKHAASAIYQCPVDEVTKDQRQIGKVSELALGYGGGRGAFKSMARNYGVHVDEADAQLIVDAWRSANHWAVAFWGCLWQAAIRAIREPMVWFPAQRVKYLYHPGMMHGTLLCQLPSGRPLCYPQIEYRTVEQDYGMRRELSYVRAFGSGYVRSKLWHGTLAENVTQAVCADILREALVKLRDVVVLHTHDEIGCEVLETEVENMKNRLLEVMTTSPSWGLDLPLDADVSWGPFYTK